MSFGKYLVLSVFGISLTGCGANSSDARQSFAKSVVDTLAASNWERSAIKPFLCDDRPKDSVDKGISFDRYQDYDGIKAIGKIKLIPMASPPPWPWTRSSPFYLTNSSRRFPPCRITPPTMQRTYSCKRRRPPKASPAWKGGVATIFR
jgi:hypothetical protein